jgi:amino acid adenylation domain-containing protein
LRGTQAEMTYAALNRASNQVARAILDDLGRGNDPVALFLEHDVCMVVGILGVLKSGRPYVPLAGALPDARILHTLDETDAELTIVSAATAERLRGVLPAHVEMLAIEDVRSRRAADVETSIAPEDAGAILFTSGSTGRPKGVIYPHRNILFNAFAQVHAYRVTRHDRIALLASYSFAASLYYIFLSVLTGARLCLYDLRQRGVEKFADWLARERVTLFHMVPTAFRSFAATLRGNESLPELRLVNIGGETVRRQDVLLYQRLLPDHCLLRVGMGMAETNACVTRVFIDKATKLPPGPVPSGYADPPQEVLLLDEQGCPVPSGAEGEIVVRSPYLSPGYWRRPELTAKVFRPDPGRPGMRLYFSGDLGRRLPDDCLVHLGRRDLQVQIRGARVEPSEIEEALMSHPALRDAVVVARSAGGGELRLVAYVIAEPGTVVSAPALKEHLRAALPEYMVPVAVVTLPEFPVTANGKLDRGALPTQERAAFVGGSPHVEARTLVERQLAKLWTESLDVPGLGVTDDFFDLGGNSLSAASLFAQIESVFGVKLPLATLLEAPTVRRLARELAESGCQGARSIMVPTRTEGRKPPLFCVASSDALAYLYLGRSLDFDQPLYALHPLGATDLHDPSIVVPDLAVRYAAEVRKVQPKGPYLIVGMCFGGIMAYELACELVRQDQAVALLGLLDTPYPWRFARMSRQLRRVWRALRRGKREGLRSIIQRCRGTLAAGGRGASSPAIDSMYWHAIPRAYRRAFATYRPGPYPGEVTLFLADETPVGLTGDQRLAWKRHARGIKATYRIPGDHEACLTEPHVRVTAARLTEAIAQALGHTTRSARST